MSDQSPSAILREAKGIHATIKELLKTKEPFEREIDFQRKNLRRRYLNLLLVHPYTKESDNVETHLWMQTSYSFISDYKQRLARIERATQRQPQGQSRHGPVEYRKLLQRFRQFLADEDKFWTQFVVRYHRSFSLDEAHPALVALGLVSEVADSPEELSPINGRNHFQFPPSTSFAPTSSSDRESRLTIVSKALVCLGDIARYREQYNESGGRSRVGPEEEGKGRKRNKRGGPPIADIPRPRNFERARTCYEQAKLLTPHDGNPSHQLAIIASYEKDMFTSLVHYYRSLCVKHPYETASENMAGLLNRTLEQRNTTGKNEVPPDIAHVPKVLIEEFKHKVVVLHALWRLGNESDDSTMVKEANNIYARFYDLVSERHLPEDFITRLVTLAQGALWKIRMLQDASSNNNIKSRPRSSVASLPSPVIEARIYTHLLSLFRALLQVSIEKLKEPPPVDSDKDLAQRLIVEFRRTLPAMRIAGKWLRANYKYVMSDPEAQGGRKGKAKHTAESSGTISPSSAETIDFWRTYAEFLRALSRTFPQDRLPDLNFALTEDTEMKGFRPLKGYMDLQRNSNGINGTEGVPLKESEVHPNDLHLMRIKDILSDAKALVEMENSPLAIYGNQFVVRGVESQVQPIPSMLPNTINQSVSPAFHEPEEDAMTELTSNTDEAVIRDAFTHLNGDDEDEDDEDDRIVWDPNPSAPPDPSPKLAPLMSTVIFGASNPPVASTVPISPPVVSVSPVAQVQPPLPSSSQSGSSRVDKTTAEDLLKGFMALGRIPELPKPGRTTSDSLVAGSPFLFDRTGSSIWSASQDEQPLRFTTSGPQAVHPLTPQTRHHNISASQDFSSQHSIWSYPNNQSSQHHSIGALPSAAPFTSHPTYPVTSHRGPTATADIYPFPSARNVNPGLSPAGSDSPQIAHQLNQSSVGMLPAPYLHAQPPPLETTSNILYDPVGTPQHFPHTRHLSFHDGPAFASPAMPSISSIWANNG